MEAALAAFENYLAQLAEVQEGLTLDPDNAELKDLLTEISAGIDATEAQLAELQKNEPSVKTEDVRMKNAERGTPPDSDEDNDDAVMEASSSDEEDPDHQNVAERHYSRDYVALLAQGWLPIAEKDNADESSAVHWKIVMPPSAAAPGEFGEWERYTRGVGSRLLTRMGYRMGQGLGRKSDGIVQPLSAGAGPRGTHGLGFEKPKKRRKRGGKRARAKRAAAELNKEEKRSNTAGAETGTAQATFDFLNTTLNRTHVKLCYIALMDFFRDPKPAAESELSSLKGKSESELKKQMFAEQERTLALARQEARLKASLERNKKDAALSSLIRSQLAQVSAQSAQAAQRQASAGARLRDEEEKKRGFKF